MTRTPCRTIRRIATPALGLLLLAGAPASVAGPVPDPLDGIVLNAGKRQVQTVTLNGVEFHYLSTFSSLPYLAWPVDLQDPPQAEDTAELTKWLADAADALGFAGFTPRHAETFDRKDHRVHRFELARDGVALHDAEILVHFDIAGIIGIVTHIEGRIAAIDPVDGTVPPDERRYYAVPQGDHYRAVSVQALRKRFADRDVVQVFGPGGELLETEHYPDIIGLPAETATFTEYPIPGSTFPDQISVAPDGTVWFSEPNIDKLMAFDPAAEQFTAYDTTGGSGPDGMIVGTQDRVWTGMYYTGQLGMLDASTGAFHTFPAPYSTAAMAIPVETSDGMVWVTDHARNRISEFDPSTGTFLQSLVMPVNNCWVVQGYEDTSRRQVYFTEYNANRLGRIDLGGSTVTDIVTPGGGPAFCVYADDKVYYSRWSESGIGVLDVPSGSITEYQFPVANEPGGPLWIRPDGDIVVGTRGRGYVMVFHVDTQTFTPLPIPTGSPGLKDGMTVGDDNTIWFTETGVRKLAKLVFTLDGCVADFDDNGTVNSLDVLAFLNAWNAGDPEADINDDGTINSLDVLEFLNLWNAGC